MGSNVPPCSDNPGTAKESTHTQLFRDERLGLDLSPGKLLPATAWGMLVIITLCVCILMPVSGFCISTISASICNTRRDETLQEGTGGSPGPLQPCAPAECHRNGCKNYKTFPFHESSYFKPMSTFTLTQCHCLLQTTHAQTGFADEGQELTTP